LPYAWFADALIWLERGVIGVAFLSALYHNLWKLGTTYKLTDHDLQVSQWFPIRMRQSVPYGAVRRLGSKQGLLGALLDYGHVEVDTGGSVPLVLVNCPRPQKFVETLQHKVEEVLQPQLLQNRS
ncbi:MAG TPA: PH domain-containing protein, partial [bacterium]|nr:PH domain-containing protein [bacterium]